MPLRDKVLVSAALLLFLVIIGALDAAFTGKLLMLPGMEEEEGVLALDDLSGQPGLVAPPPVVGGGVSKSGGPDVAETLAVLGLEQREEQETSLLRRVLPQTIPVQGFALLKDGDRVGALAWAETPDVKTYFLALKEALHASFTPQVKDLVDETHRREGKPVRNFLTFSDAGIASERMVFIRVRERLYEFRIAEGKETAMFELIEALTN